MVREKLASLGSLTAGIAHELKNPLNFVSNFAQGSAELTRDIAALVGEHRASLDQGFTADLDGMLGMLQEATSKIEEHGHRATQIIDGMARHARASSGERAPTDLNALVAESVTLAQEAVRTRDAEPPPAVDCRYDDAIEALEMAPLEIGRVVMNVMDNAYYAVRQRRRAAGPSYAPRIEVHTVDHGERVEVRVRDNGTGIPAAMLGRVFEPFFTTKPPGAGAGLGLSISHDIVAKGHQGEIRITSVEGDHTEVVIALPKGPSRAGATHASND
jgi:signal transduction histidine kinase